MVHEEDQLSTPKTLNPEIFMKQIATEPVPETPEELEQQISALSTGHWATPDLVAAVRTKVRQFIQVRIIATEHYCRTIREALLEECVYIRGDPNKRFPMRGAEIRVNLQPWLEDWASAWEETWALHLEEKARADAESLATRPLTRLKTSPLRGIPFARGNMQRRVDELRHQARLNREAYKTDPLKAACEYTADAYDAAAAKLEDYLDALEVE